MNQGVLPELTIVGDIDFEAVSKSSTSGRGRADSNQSQKNNTPEVVKQLLSRLAETASNACSQQELVEGVAETACHLVGFGPMLKALSTTKVTA